MTIALLDSQCVRTSKNTHRDLYTKKLGGKYISSWSTSAEKCLSVQNQNIYMNGVNGKSGKIALNGNIYTSSNIYMNGINGENGKGGLVGSTSFVTNNTGINGIHGKSVLDGNIYSTANIYTSSNVYMNGINGTPADIGSAAQLINGEERAWRSIDWHKRNPAVMENGSNMDKAATPYLQRGPYGTLLDKEQQGKALFSHNWRRKEEDRRLHVTKSWRQATLLQAQLAAAGLRMVGRNYGKRISCPDTTGADSTEESTGVFWPQRKGEGSSRTCGRALGEGSHLQGGWGDSATRGDVTIAVSKKEKWKMETLYGLTVCEPNASLQEI